LECKFLRSDIQILPFFDRDEEDSLIPSPMARHPAEFNSGGKRRIEPASAKRTGFNSGEADQSKMFLLLMASTGLRDLARAG